MAASTRLAVGVAMNLRKKQGRVATANERYPQLDCSTHAMPIGGVASFISSVWIRTGIQTRRTHSSDCCSAARIKAVRPNSSAALDRRLARATIAGSRFVQRRQPLRAACCRSDPAHPQVPHEPRQRQLRQHHRGVRNRECPSCAVLSRKLLCPRQRRARRRRLLPDLQETPRQPRSKVHPDRRGQRRDASTSEPQAHMPIIAVRLSEMAQSKDWPARCRRPAHIRLQIAVERVIPVGPREADFDICRPALVDHAEDQDRRWAKATPGAV